MAAVAQVVDGKIVNNGTSAAEKAASGEAQKTTGGGSLGKDAFLQLLVAQMKYQDPLAASNNSTEYISQLATFSELESMQNLQEISEQQRMQNLVGKTVVLDVDGKQFTGQVDFLQYENGKAKMSVGGTLYSIDDLYQVIDGEYLTAYTEASNFISKLYRLPSLENLTEKDAEIVHELEDDYANMTEYGKSFIADEAVELLNRLGPRAEVLSPRKEVVDYDKLMIEKLDDLIGMMGGVNKDKINEVLDKLLEEQLPSGSGSAGGGENADNVTGTEGTGSGAEGSENAGGTTGTEGAGNSAEGGENAGGTTGTEGAGNSAEGSENAGGTAGAESAGSGADSSEIAGAGSVTDTDSE
ncbi:MAG: hypothetical protein NC409_01570 [Clostridium sp.]|nr:hypothetical protein [Clostridium sp.]